MKITSHNTPVEFDHFTFSGGEPHIRIKSPIGHQVSITQRVSSFNDLGALLVAIDACRRVGAAHIDLVIPYFPGARQDRVCNPGEALTARMYADIVNSLNAASVTIVDPHSDVVPALLNNCRIRTLEDWVSQSMTFNENCVAICPDAGALKKVTSIAKKHDLPLIKCDKSRDITTGQIKGFEVGAGDVAGMACYIFDDICDGGATFTGLAKELKDRGAPKVFLVVSHGIFSKGIAPLLAHIDHIYTTNSICENYADNPLMEKGSHKVTQYQII